MASTGLARGSPRERQYRAAFAQDNIQPASLQQQLAGRDTIYGGQGQVADYDWTILGVPLAAYVLLARRAGIAARSYEDVQPASPLGTLRGQDRVYGNPGQVGDYDWPNPRTVVGRRPWMDTTVDLSPSLLGTAPPPPVVPLDWLNPRLPDRTWPRRSQSDLTHLFPNRNPSSSQQALGNPVAAQMNTTWTNDLSADGFTWAQGDPSFDDKYGNPITLVQRHNGGTKQHNFTYSNTAGASWTDASIAEGGIDRGGCAYDAGHDLIHVAYNGSAVSDGIFYRRYLISYTAGTKQISGIARLDGVSVVLDNQQSGESVTYAHPVALFCEDVTLGGAATVGNTLVFIYGIYNANVANPGFEVRSVARALTYDASDGTAANWRSPRTSGGAPLGSTSAIGNTPLAGSYRALNASTSGTDVPYPAALRITWPSGGSSAIEGSIHVFFARRVATPTWNRLKMTWSAAAAGWNEGSSTSADSITQAGTDTGYSLKTQLVSKMSGDPTNDKFYVGYPVWKSDALGDTWRVRRYDPTSLSSTAVDLYSAGGSNTDVAQDMFVAGDVQWDDTSGALVVAYGDLPRHDVYVATMDSSLRLIGAAPLAIPSAFTTAPCDIPTIHPSRVNGKTAIVFRDFNAGARNNPPTYTPPYLGWWLTLDWVDPRPQEPLVYWHPSARRLGALEQPLNLQSTLLGQVTPPPLLPVDWLLPQIVRRLRLDHAPLGLVETTLAGQDVVYGPPGMVGDYAWTVPPGPRRPIQPEQPLALLGTLLFVIPPVPLTPLDFPNPLRREPTRDNRLHLASGYPLQLRGQDAVYGPPGMVPAYDWTGVPKGRPPGVVTNRDHLVNLVIRTLLGQDRFYAGFGQVPTHDLEQKGITPRGQLNRLAARWRAVLSQEDVTVRTSDGVVIVSLGEVVLALISPTIGVVLTSPGVAMGLASPDLDLDLGG